MKENKKSAQALQAAGFLLCAAAMVFCLTRVMKIHALSDTTRNGFFYQAENSLDVVYLGNCHAYSTLMPSVVEEFTGYRGFVLGAGNQMGEMTYYYMQSALNRQSPRYVVVEVFPFVIEESYAAGEGLEAYFVASYADLPMMDRLAYLGEIRENGHPWQYALFELGYFHGRWSELEALGTGWGSEDNGWKEYNADEEAILRDRLEEPLDLPQTEERLALEDNSLEYLHKTIQLAEESGVQLIFVAAPYLDMTEREAARYNTIGDIAAENGIPWLNYTGTELLEELGLCRGHMMDTNHVNEAGALLISAHVGGVIRELEQSAG